MRIVFLGKNKPYAAKALSSLMAAGHHVLRVVAPETDTPYSLNGIARNEAIPTCSPRELYDEMPSDVDLVISYLFWQRIKPPLIQLGRLGCINFHPAPLPDFRGVGGYNVAILEGLSQWGASAHFVDEAFDTGDVIQIRRFDFDASRATAWSLERQTQREMYGLFNEVMGQLESGEGLPRSQQGEGRYINKADFEAMRRIQPTDSPEIIDRKIRAFWYPPFGGAFTEINGREYTLVNDKLLQEIASNPPKEDIG